MSSWNGRYWALQDMIEQAKRTLEYHPEDEHAKVNLKYAEDKLKEHIENKYA